MAFWKAHTANVDPKPAPPQVDWANEMGLASVMGFQTNGGGPSIQIEEVQENECHIEATVVNYRIPGPLDVITNPYHFVAVPRSLKEVRFKHLTVLP